MTIKDRQDIDVYLGEDLVGTLRQIPQKDQCAFEYSQSWLKGGYSISPWELPLKSGLIFSRQGCFRGGFAAFEDSLPDGYGLYLLDRLLRREGSSLKALSAVQRLALVGDAGMGALRYQPDFGVKQSMAEECSMDFDSLQGKALDILSERTEADAELLYYNSHNSGGARPKAVFAADDGSSWIVKFRHTYDPLDIGRMEYKYMSFARGCGIKIPDIRLIRDKYFAIRRFDLQGGRRIHTLTASALLQSDMHGQSVDYSNLLALTGYLTQDPEQVEQMFRRMVYNVIVDNKDDHAKNFSFLCDCGVWSLAPAYDITYSPEGTRGEHATSVMYAGNPALEDILRAGAGIHISRGRCLEITKQIQEVCRSGGIDAVTLLK